MSYQWTADSTSLTVDSSQYTVDSPGIANFPILTAVQFAARMLRLYPRGWVGDAAQNPGGVAYATFLGIGTPLGSFMQQLLFIRAGLRIKTAFGTALDIISVDYFGPNGLPRNPGESDSSFRTRILQTLLIPRVTRSAIQNAVALATNVTPRMGEPWTSGGDASAWDTNSYWGTDGAQDIAPGRWGDTLPWLGFVDVTAPVTTVSGGFPIYGWDVGAAWDVGLSAYDLSGTPSSTYIDPNYETTVFTRVQKFKAFGVTVGVRFTAATKSTVLGFASSTVNSTNIAFSDTALTFVLQSWLQSFGVWLEVLPWTAISWLSTRGISFDFTSDVPAASAATIGWIAALYTSTNPLALRVPVNYGQTSVSCSFSIPAGTVPIITIDWEAVPYVTALTSSSLTIQIDQSLPHALATETGTLLSTESGSLLITGTVLNSGNLDIIFLPGSSAAVAAAATTLVVTDSSLPTSYALFATPSWNTAMNVAKGSGTFTLTFGTPAPTGGGTVYWAAVEN